LAINFSPNLKQISIAGTLQGGMGTFIALVCTCLLLFEQLTEQQMVRFQDSILELLNHYTLFNMLFDDTFEAHCA
jgi:hypothetical protein